MRIRGPAFKFFLKVTIFLSITTPAANYLGIESTDISSAYQAQIISFRLLKTFLLPRYGVYGYVVEGFLILGASVIILPSLTAFLHIVYRLMGGDGSIIYAWKSACYGVAPCILGGFLPYISLFAAFYSLILQLYIGPKVLYRVKEGR